MPWCEACEHYLAPNALTENGECPECGGQCSKEKSNKVKKRKKFKIPWHLWILISVLGVYLCWRLIQLIVWLL